ncbi:hypothetical protein BJ138DRAFT_1191351 [Hygrophoropsis aurantiaca]|uniref:Uncharacterized protein n=1 Tax=Hygrophoropsis aurantiaca TaxID=72124 RepID=A0ACB7ZTE2_9AGAM|nr:hypothetical protein BJ138DRAFT_1191351 [Hygrophoropsis aurantiaca]
MAMSVFGALGRYGGRHSARMRRRVMYEVCFDCASIRDCDVNLSMVVGWGQTVFILTMQTILVIRVYALFKQSKNVLIFLAMFYALQTAAIFVMTALLFNTRVLHEYGESTQAP